LSIQYSKDNSFQLRNRLEEIAKLLGEPSPEDLYQRAKRQGIGGSFQQLLLDLATNNEPSFFRDPRVFRALEEAWIRPQVERKSKSPLRIWSAASSTGQEALSLAMCVMESAPGLQFEIIATDISDRVLERAREGSYSQLEVQRGLSTALLLKYFDKEGRLERWRAKSVLLDKIKYSKQNLLSPLLVQGPFDLVLCRNVLIYQSVENKRMVIARIASQLKEEGLLVLGSGESLIGLSNDFVSVNCSGAILFKKNDF
jgi:chemotaxis protein methyltransferase CheR